jgi:hypothetical protein
VYINYRYRPISKKLSVVVDQCKLLVYQSEIYTIKAVSVQSSCLRILLAVGSVRVNYCDEYLDFGLLVV